MTDLFIYNTPKKKVEKFIPIDVNNISFYSCGPTVYDYPHIGNWYTFIRYDVLYRLLKTKYSNVNWIMNITDVGHLVSDADEGQDKIVKGALREGKTAWDLADKYSKYFIDGLNLLNNSKPSKMPKATDHIQEQIDLIRTLEKKGHTYIIKDGVYFDTKTFSRYSDFANLDIKNQQSTSRIDSNYDKKNQSDFALWKFSPKDTKRDMEWDSPWGKGFPGWHIECSAMSMKYLGDTLDIHGGGIDHIPVHHTNEIAQSEAATGKTFSNYWFHSHFNLVDGKKMSKSAKNFYTLEDINKKGFSFQAFRLLVLHAHYRTDAHFSWDNLRAAQNRLQKWVQTYALIYQLNEKSEPTELNIDNLKTILFNDINTPEALTYIDKVLESFKNNGVSSQSKNQLINFAKEINRLLGIDISCDDISSELKELIKRRQYARDNNDFNLSDKIRGQLKDKNIGINDNPNSQTWFPIIGN